MNLNDIMQAAQGGQGVTNLAAQFGLSPQQAQAAIQAMIPAFSTGLQQSAANPGALGGILSQLASGAHQASYSSPTPTGAAATAGGDVLGHIFGSPQVAAQVGQQAAAMTGLSPQIIQQMMPAVASMMMGGLFHNMNAQGMGGMLSQLASAAAAPGGLGSAMGQPPAPGGGMFGGLLGTVMSSLTGGGQAGANPQAAAMQAGLNSLTNMFQGGVQVSQAHQQGLSDIMGALMGQKKA